ncbi:DUF6090 family protein [Winogradskyella jejuensis]|uniref:Uncharacterized protein n=1 Tax=Winogradskyella jejuensis TaxID=1089305 RepID=A0A1M5SV44_9FLAO|nr:DUF6090 family protein [Winogradskyella jejuensis]SHH41863.1 hypothetical protein SAMN05444148_1967 [Winogradskyella jejuensis]
MIKLFKSIRRKLLTENRFNKYLLYAIGEIILVVIGILIALGINNWNENRKSSIQEVEVLKSLRNNLQQAEKQSKALINHETEVKQILIESINTANENNRYHTKQITDSIFKIAVWDLQRDLPTLTTYLNLKNTNQLGLIKNKVISEKFTQLDFKYNRLSDILNDRLNVQEIRIDNISENEINFIPLIKSEIPEIDSANEIATDYIEILKDKNVRNLLGMKLTLTQDILTRRLELDTEIKELLQLIDAQLKIR